MVKHCTEKKRTIFIQNCNNSEIKILNCIIFINLMFSMIQESEQHPHIFFLLLSNLYSKFT